MLIETSENNNDCYSSCLAKNINLINHRAAENCKLFICRRPQIDMEEKRKQTSTHLLIKFYNRNQMVLHLWVVIIYARYSPECLNKKGTGQLSALLNQPWLDASPWKQDKKGKKLMTMNTKFQGQATLGFGCRSVVHWQQQIILMTV